jgi:hypothetical protein
MLSPTSAAHAPGEVSRTPIARITKRSPFFIYTSSEFFDSEILKLETPAVCFSKATLIFRPPHGLWYSFLPSPPSPVPDLFLLYRASMGFSKTHVPYCPLFSVIPEKAENPSFFLNQGHAWKGRDASEFMNGTFAAGQDQPI